MSRPRRARVAAAALGAALAAPAAAQAASVAVPPCSVTLPGQRTVAVQGSGYTPGGSVRLVADGRTIASGVPVDAGGRFTTAVVAPALTSPRRNVQTFELTVADGAGVSAGAPLRIARVTAALPERARPASRVLIRAFGFAPGRRVWLHVRRGRRTRGSFALGRASAPCGIASRRLRYMPLRRWRPGVYEYVFQLSARYRPAEPAVRLHVAITRGAGPG